MSKKIDELLAVLDMPEMEQAVALYNLGYDVIFDRCRVHWNWVGGGTGKLESIDEAHAGLPYINNEQLADLAFRLRDEVDDELYIKALHSVREFHSVKVARALRADDRASRINYGRYQTFENFLAIAITSIDRIIAALIAKERK